MRHIEKEKHVVTPPPLPVVKRKPGRPSTGKKRGRPRIYPKTDDEEEEEDIVEDEYDFVDETEKYKKAEKEKKLKVLTPLSVSPAAKRKPGRVSTGKKRGRRPLNKDKSMCSFKV